MMIMAEISTRIRRPRPPVEISRIDDLNIRIRNPPYLSLYSLVSRDHPIPIIRV